MIEEVQKPIRKRELQALSKTKLIQIRLFFKALETITPFTGKLEINQKYDFLFVKGALKTFIFSVCDRYLISLYNQELIYDSEEIIRIQKPTKDYLINCEDKLLDKLIETIPKGAFDPSKWIFDQLNLKILLIKMCTDSCPRPSVLNKKEENEDKPMQSSIDPRWDVLKKLLKP